METLVNGGVGETSPDVVAPSVASADTVPPPPPPSKGLAVALLEPAPGEDDGAGETVGGGVYVERGALAEEAGDSVPQPSKLLWEEEEGLEEVEGKGELLTLPPPKGVSDIRAVGEAREEALINEVLVMDKKEEAEPPPPPLSPFLPLPLDVDPEEDGDATPVGEGLDEEEDEMDTSPVEEGLGDMLKDGDA